MVLPFGPDLAAGTPRALARRQGTQVDSDRAESPGKIRHEVRRTAFGDPASGLELSPYYGTVDATSLWISLLYDAWRWGMAHHEVEALLPNLCGGSPTHLRDRVRARLWVGEGAHRYLGIAVDGHGDTVD